MKNPKGGGSEVAADEVQDSPPPEDLELAIVGRVHVTTVYGHRMHTVVRQTPSGPDRWGWGLIWPPQNLHRLDPAEKGQF